MGQALLLLALLIAGLFLLKALGFVGALIYAILFGSPRLRDEDLDDFDDWDDD